MIVGISSSIGKPRKLYFPEDDGASIVKDVENINAYLVAGPSYIVETEKKNRNGYSEMVRGNTGNDGGHLYMTADQLVAMNLKADVRTKFTRQVYGSDEFINGATRYCIWIDSERLEAARQIPELVARIEAVRTVRLGSRDPGAQKMADRPHQFREMNQPRDSMIVIPRVSSEGRPYLPVGLLASPNVISDRNFALYDAPLWNMALIASRLHLVWIATVCGKLKTDFRYSNTLGWNTFPVPTLTEQNKADLTACAENILLAREAHFPATIADLYDPEAMPDNLRAAHERNDETLERIYIGRRFKNDTERLEKLFELYTKMTTAAGAKGKPAAKTVRGKATP